MPSPGAAELLAAVGYAEGTEPLDELKRIQPGAPDSRLVVGHWSRSEMLGCVIGTQLKVAGTGVVVSVLRAGRPARNTVFAGPPGSAAEWLRQAGVRVGNGSPIVVDAKASIVHVGVDTASGVLRLDVRDDGVGGADPARGSGLIGLRDRVEATGGTFRLTSRPGEGTHLQIELPVPEGLTADR